MERKKIHRFSSSPGKLWKFRVCVKVVRTQGKGTGTQSMQRTVAFASRYRENKAKAGFKNGILPGVRLEKT